MQSTHQINILDILLLLNKGIQEYSYKTRESYQKDRCLSWFKQVDDGLCNGYDLLNEWDKYGTIRTN